MLESRPKNQSLIQEKRLVLRQIDPAEVRPQIKPGSKFETKYKEHYKTLTDKLKKDFDAKIKKYEKAGKETDEIEKKLKDEKGKMARKAIDMALKDAKVTTTDKKKKKHIVTYLDLFNSGNGPIVTRITNIRDDLEAKYEKRVEEAVKAYENEKQATSDKTKTRLEKLPKPLERDFDKENAETKGLEAIQKKREDAKAKSRKEREKIIDRGDDYKVRMEIANKMTSPVGGIIDDYDDGYFGDDTDEKNSRRDNLNGYLYAHDIFNGGKGEGKKAMEEAIKEPKRLYESSWTDHIFTKSDLEEGMQLKTYLDEAKDYTSHHTCQGVVAGLLKIADNNIASPSIKRKYKQHIKSAFREIGEIDSKDKQLHRLFQIQPISEFMAVDPEWKKRVKRIEDLTDPNRSGDDVIDDYPDTENWENDEDMTNEYNKTREAFIGYLLGVNTLKTSQAMKNDYSRAYTMYKDVWGDMLEWEHLERVSKGSDGDDDGFGLEKYLSEAKTMTKHYRVMGFIAGIKKMMDGGKMGSEYESYIEKTLKNLSTDQSEEAQMAILSTIKSPEQAKEQVRIDAYEVIMDSVIEATKQHNLYKVGEATGKEKSINDRLKEDPLKKKNGVLVMSLKDYEQLAQDIKDDINKFVDERVNNKKTGLRKNLSDRYNTLITNNNRLKNPRYTNEEIKELLDEVKAVNVELAKAKVDTKNNLEKVISEGYLEQLTKAEKDHFETSKKIDSMLAAVNEESKGTKPTQQPPKNTPAPGLTPKPQPGPGRGPGTAPTRLRDKFKDNWGNAERVTPAVGGYVGKMILDTLVTGGNVNLRNGLGAVIKAVPNGTEVNRTTADSKVKARRVEGINFIQVHWRGKPVWVAETLCIKQGGEQPTVPPKTVPAQPRTPERPAYSANPWDHIFGKVTSEVETNPNGSHFSFKYNGMMAGCHVQKINGRYQLKTTHPESGFFVVTFNNVGEIRNFSEQGRLYQYLAVNSLKNRRNWNRLRDRGWKADIKTLRQTSGTGFFVEMDWKRNNLFETGNAKIMLNVGTDGRINYRIVKDNVGPDGEKVKTGFVSDMMQLQQTLSHLRHWSEGYESSKRSEAFPAHQDFERRASELMNPGSFDQQSARIGQKYYFNSFRVSRYAYMYLDWDNAGSTRGRNSSFKNPILEVKMNTNKTINWKLINRTGSGGQWVGTQGRGNSFNEVMDQIQRVRANPGAAMRTPATRLYNLGSFGNNLTA